MDLWIEAFDTFGAATLMLSEAFKGFFAFKPMKDEEMGTPLSSPYLPVAEGFSDIAKKLNRTILPSVRQLFEVRCLQPTAAILAMVGPIDALLAERRSVLLDFDSYRAKIEKEHAAGRDSRHPMVIKKALKLDEVAKQLHSLNSTILASFVEFEKARCVTMGPEFTSFMACFYHFSSYSTELSGKVLPDMPQVASSLYILESFIGQSFNSPTRNEDTGEVIEPVSTKREPLEVVTERSEYAGGDYGGYSSHSTVLPAHYKDEEIEQQIDHELAMSEVPDIDDCATSETSEFTASTSAALDSTKDFLDVGPNTPAMSVGSQLSQEKIVNVDAIRSLLPTSPPAPPVRPSAAVDQSLNSTASSPTPSGSIMSEPSSPAVSVTKPPKPTPSTATTPAPASPAEATPPPKRTSMFASFFTRTPLPVAKTVVAEELVPTTVEEAEIPIVEACLDTRPEKPPKPADLKPEPTTDASPEVLLSESQPEGAPEAVLYTSPPKPDRSSSPHPGRSSDSGSPASGAYRNTISLARGSIEGDLSDDVSTRKPMESSPTPPLKPLKPPKQSKSAGDSSKEGVGTPASFSGACEATSPMPGNDSTSVEGTTSAAETTGVVIQPTIVQEAPAEESGAPSPNAEYADLSASAGVDADALQAEPSNDIY